MNTRMFWRVPLLLTACMIVWRLDTSAQSIWLGSRSTDGVSIEINKPFFDDGDVSFGTGSVFISGQFTLSKTMKGVFEIPFARTAVDDQFGDFNEASLGNPYIGLSSIGEGARTWFEVGVRLPLNSGDGWLVPGALDNVDRWGSFGEDLATVSAAFNNVVAAAPVTFRLRLNPTALVPTKGGDVEMCLNYSGFAWIGENNVQFGAGILGWAIVTESDLNFGERTIHQLGLAARIDLRSVIIGMKGSLPLDKDLSDIFDGTIGLNLTVPFRRSGP